MPGAITNVDSSKKHEVELLKEVSRSFYLTLRVLPASVRTPIGLAYLLARTSDTIADTQLVSVEKRLDALRALRRRIAGTRDALLDFGNLATGQSSRAEQTLLERCENSLDLLGSLDGADRDRVRKVLDIIVGGQELDLQRFGAASPRQLVALPTDADLDDYTYRVAGCVGEFWTVMCRAHVFPNAKLDDALLMKQSVRFGKGLQLVNILRDLPADLRMGRCYLPEEKLMTTGLTPAALLSPDNATKLRPLYIAYLEQANEHLLTGWAYTNALPRRSMRVRLACAWPVLIGLQTVKLLRTANMLDPGQRIKISRREVKQWMWRSVLYYPWPTAWRALAQR